MRNLEVQKLETIKIDLNSLLTSTCEKWGVDPEEADRIEYSNPAISHLLKPIVFQSLFKLETNFYNDMLETLDLDLNVFSKELLTKRYDKEIKWMLSFYSRITEDYADNLDSYKHDCRLRPYTHKQQLCSYEFRINCCRFLIDTLKIL
jgi:hypothetical protein